MSEEHIVCSMNLEKNKKLIVTNKRIIITKQHRLADSILIAVAYSFCSWVGINFGWRLALLLFLVFALPFTFLLAEYRLKQERKLEMKGRHFHLVNAKIVFARSRFSRLDPVKISIEDTFGKEEFELGPGQAEKLLETLESLKAWTLQTYKV